MTDNPTSAPPATPAGLPGGAQDSSAEAWKTRSSWWVQHAAVYNYALAPFNDLILDAAGISPDQVVLDVGCGPGGLLADVAATGATTVGVDISEDMVTAAREAVPAATLVVGDAETTDCAAAANTGPFDRIVSRFGVMFFNNPVAAFTTLRQSCAPGGTLTFACWSQEERDMFELGLDTYEELLDEKVPLPGVGEPGPRGLGDPALIHRILGDAGWRNVVVEPADVTCDFTMGTDDGVARRLHMISGGAVGQAVRESIRERHGDDVLAEVDQRAEDRLRERMPDGVKFRSKGLLVTASA